MSIFTICGNVRRKGINMSNNTVYTNSPLACVTNLSPNHSGMRTHALDRITPHCVVGQATAERIGEIFAPTARQASCNYGIGKDGRIILVCEEKNRSWCTSSRENDQRAITIEVASDSKHPYAFKPEAYNALIELCIDICRRNGKKKLLWLADKNKTLAYKPAEDEMVLSVHRWFANKSCPGDWMYSRMGDLAEKVTAQLNATTTTPSIAPTTPTTAESREQTIWDTLFAAIGNAYGVAGLMGNLYAEAHQRLTDVAHEDVIAVIRLPGGTLVLDGRVEDVVNLVEIALRTGFLVNPYGGSVLVVAPAAVFVLEGTHAHGENVALFAPFVHDFIQIGEVEHALLRVDVRPVEAQIELIQAGECRRVADEIVAVAVARTMVAAVDVMPIPALVGIFQHGLFIAQRV